jgi:hypothetical protein
VTYVPAGRSESESPRVACAKQADAQLDELLEAVLIARREMRTELGTQPLVRNREMFARHRLLGSLEAYVSALTAHGLSAPPRLRDELALQRNLAAKR